MTNETGEGKRLWKGMEIPALEASGEGLPNTKVGENTYEIISNRETRCLTKRRHQQNGKGKGSLSIEGKENDALGNLSDLCVCVSKGLKRGTSRCIFLSGKAHRESPRRERKGGGLAPSSSPTSEVKSTLDPPLREGNGTT